MEAGRPADRASELEGVEQPEIFAGIFILSS